MILVTVGTEKFPLNRLMEWIDNLINQKLIQPEKEEVLIQYGSCTFLPKNITGYSILRETEFLSLVEKARIIIAHCGEGSLDLLGSINKPFILVPRSYNFREHVDDHQVELAHQLAKLGVPIANNQEDLAAFLTQPFVVKLPVTPAKYYAQVSLLLEDEFETDLVREELSDQLIDTPDFLHILA
jgi:UDP-N-acetylglucosamine transferase subunit ALG13